jgi:hypothetical protein
MRKVQAKQKGLKLKGTHQLLVYADDDNVLVESIHTIKKTEASSFASNKIGLQVNAEKSICSCLMNRMQNEIIA